METHVKLLGWGYILSGAFGLLIAGLLGVILVGSGIISQDRTALFVTTMVALVMGLLIFVFSLPGIVAGAGLLAYKNWARILALGLGALNLPAFPVGTALGLYTFFVLLEDETGRLFNPGQAALPAYDRPLLQ